VQANPARTGKQSVTALQEALTSMDNEFYGLTGYERDDA
jgi:hypothetical protein